MKNIIVIFLLILPSLFCCAQTTVTVPTTVKYSNVPGLGINLGSSCQYGTCQIVNNLISPANGGFEPQTWITTSNAGSCADTTHWTDSTNYNYTGTFQGANWYAGASFTVISGANIGITGTVTSSTAASYSGGVGTPVTLTLGTALTSACAAGDMMVLRITNPSTSWTGYQTPAASTTYFTVSGSTSYNTTDVSPTSPNQVQSLALASSGAYWSAYFDGTINGKQYLNLNGQYCMTWKDKALAADTLTATVTRNGVALMTQTVTPTVNTSSGAGWSSRSFCFTGTETGSQTGNGNVKIASTNGHSLIQDVAFTEQPQLSGNNTVLRDSVFAKLKNMHPGVLRWMDGSFWASTFDNLIQPDYGMRPSGFNWYLTSAPSGIAFNLPEFLAIANAVGAAPWITLPYEMTTTEMQHAVQYLAGNYGGNTTNYIALFAAKGQNIYLELGNEVWNPTNGGTDYQNGDQGTAYGKIVGADFAAARAATGYTTTIKLVADGRQVGQYGWCDYVLTAAGGVTNGQADQCDLEGYQATVITQMSTDAAALYPQFTEPLNLDTLSSGGIYSAQAWNQSAHGVATSVYETQYAPGVYLTGTTQAQIDNYAGGIGGGVAEIEHQMLMLEDNILVQNVFILGGTVQYPANLCTSTSGGCSLSGSIYTPIWSTEEFMAGGPAQPSFVNVDRPTGTALSMVNNAVGTNSSLLAVTQSGTPTFSQTAAQPDPTNSGNNNVAANSAVPYVQCHGFSKGSNQYALVCVNINLTTGEPITFAGSAAPTGSVTRTIFGGTTHLVTDNCETVALGSTCAASTLQSATLTNPSGDTLQPYSVTSYTYTLGSSTNGQAVISGKISISGNTSIY